AVTMASILANKAPADFIHFYILENAFTESDRKKLEKLKSLADFDITYINVQDKILDVCPFQENDRLSIAAYFRLFIPELIPNEDKVIYLDCDLVVRSSLSALYEMDFGNNYILGVRDSGYKHLSKRLSTRHYINSGVMLMNSRKMREDGIQSKFIDYITNNREKILFHDQDVISGVLDGFIGYISDKWNGQVERLALVKPEFSRYYNAYILHYIGDGKPWLPYVKSTLPEDYFRYLRLTPFADYEKTYRRRRFWWNLMRSYSHVGRLIYFQRTSSKKTYRYYRILGVGFKKRLKATKR
ncbi:MAG: glycosyltransferase family 8 protein, partial [Oxalobacter sp.]|nr:glycosyltransferase family 8 protein [Oxalobacter sp.]